MEEEFDDDLTEDMEEVQVEATEIVDEEFWEILNG